MSTTVEFQPVEETGWRRGLGNLLQGELSSWFKSSRWWKQLIIWLLTIDLLLMFTILGSKGDTGEEAAPIVFLYGVYGGLFVAIGVMIIMQRTIVGEKRAGTAAWVLSKPVTRPAFVVSRLVVNAMGIAFTAALVPALVAYLMYGGLSDVGWLPFLSYLGAVLLHVLHVLFWATLTWMVGTFSNSTGTVIAVPMVVLFGSWFLVGIIPGLEYVAPLMLAFGQEVGDFPALATSLMNGDAPYSWLPLVSTLILIPVFIAVGIRRFNREEF